MLLQTIAITSDTTNATNKRVVTGTKVTTELIEAQWFLQTALKFTDADVTKDTKHDISMQTQRNSLPSGLRSLDTAS